jgi:GT2 family glycosyltransferase
MLMSKVDIITTSYSGNADKLKMCIPAILENTNYVEYKWYLWVNAPDEKTKKIVHDSLFVDDILFTDRVEPIFNDNNDGSFSSNNNEASKEGSSEYILFMNDDIEPINNSWLFSMVNILDNDPKIGAVGAMLLYPNKLIQHVGVMFDERTNGLPYHIFYQKPPTEFVTKNRYYQAVTAACMLVRRADFEMLGGFNEEYFYGYEDTDLCLKITHTLGKKIVYCAGAQLIHHEGISGTFKEHPKLKENIKVFRGAWGSKIFNDHRFYLSNPNFMVYKK